MRELENGSGLQCGMMGWGWMGELDKGWRRWKIEVDWNVG